MRFIDEKRSLEEELQKERKNHESTKIKVTRRVTEVESKIKSLQENLDHEKKHLQEELQQKECKICFNAEISMLFQPCHHVSTCDRCSMTITQCPICRQIITEKIKAFM